MHLYWRRCFSCISSKPMCVQTPTDNLSCGLCFLIQKTFVNFLWRCWVVVGIWGRSFITYKWQSSSLKKQVLLSVATWESAGQEEGQAVSLGKQHHLGLDWSSDCSRRLWFMLQLRQPRRLLLMKGVILLSFCSHYRVPILSFVPALALDPWPSQFSSVTHLRTVHCWINEFDVVKDLRSARAGIKEGVETTP